MIDDTPWKAIDLHGDWSSDVFPWGITDRWGVVIGRFDTEAQARTVVDAVNSRLPQSVGSPT